MNLVFNVGWRRENNGGGSFACYFKYLNSGARGHLMQQFLTVEPSLAEHDYQKRMMDPLGGVRLKFKIKGALHFKYFEEETFFNKAEDINGGCSVIIDAKHKLVTNLTLYTERE